MNLAVAYAAASAASVDARSVYLQALDVMSQLPQPAFVTYTLQSTSHGLKGELSEHCVPCLTPGNNTDRWSVWHRTDDYSSFVQNDFDGKGYFSRRPNFDPTWYGAYHALHGGMIESINNYRIPAGATPAPIMHTSAPPQSTLKTISAVTVLGPAIYNVQDRGAALCPNGSAGRALHLWSRTNDPRHQLSDVIVELPSLRFCMVRLALNAPGLMGGNGVWELHFGQVGGYWMITGGTVDGTMRLLGIKAYHGAWAFRLTEMQFPSFLDPAMFDESTPA